MMQSTAIRSAELTQWLDIMMSRSKFERDVVQKDRDNLDVKTSIYNDLKSKLKTLQDLVKDFAETGVYSQFGAKTVSVSNEDILRVSAGGVAASLSHSIHVDQLAHAHSVLSDQYTQAGTELSSAHSGTKNFSITVDGNQYDVSVEVGASDDNETVLTSIVDAINGVTDIEAIASKVNDTDSTSKLSITSEETGTDYKMTFTDTDGLLASLGVTNGSAATTSTGGYVYADQGGNELDSMLTVNGISIVKSSNTLSDVIAGVTLELLASQDVADADVSVSVAVDNTEITSKVKEFLTAYNETYAYLATKIHVDKTTYARGPLAGNYTYTSLWSNMRSNLSGQVSSATNGLVSALSQIGITSGESGNFTITDTDKFDDALTDNLSGVEELFNSSDGVAVQLEDLIDNYVDVSGIIDSSKESVTDKIELYDNKLERLDRMRQFEEERLIQQYGALQQATYMNQALLGMLSNLNSAY